MSVTEKIINSAVAKDTFLLQQTLTLTDAQIWNLLTLLGLDYPAVTTRSIGFDSVNNRFFLTFATGYGTFQYLTPNLNSIFVPTLGGSTGPALTTDWTKIDETPIPSDADYIAVVGSGTYNIRCGGGGPVAPASGSYNGTYYVYRWGEIDASGPPWTATVQVDMYQGDPSGTGVRIHTGAAAVAPIQDGTTFANMLVFLTGAEAATITNPADLWLKVTTVGTLFQGCPISWAQIRIPA